MTIIAELKTIKCSEELIDLEHYRPDCDEPFGIGIQAIFVPYRSELEKEVSLKITVCNPAWLKLMSQKDSILIGHSHLIVKKFDLPKIRKYLTSLGHRSHDETREKVVSRLARYGQVLNKQ